MLKSANIHNKKEFIQTISKYIHLDKLKDYIARLNAYDTPGSTAPGDTSLGSCALPSGTP